MHAIYSYIENTYIHQNESKHSEMGPVRQNPIDMVYHYQFLHVSHCHVCMSLFHTQNFHIDMSLNGFL